MSDRTTEPKCALHAKDAAEAYHCRGMPCVICGGVSQGADPSPVSAPEREETREEGEDEATLLDTWMTDLAKISKHLEATGYPREADHALEVRRYLRNRYLALSPAPEGGTAPDEALASLYWLLELVKHANPGAFTNGVTDSTGSIDEGEVRAGQIIADARRALASLRAPEGRGAEAASGEALARAVLQLWDARPAVVANDAHYWRQMREQDAKREEVLRLAREIVSAPPSPHAVATTEGTQGGSE